MLKRNWALIAFVYLALAEVLSLVPVPDLSLCLISPEHDQQAADHHDKKYCPAFHTGAAFIFEKVDSFLERHDKSVVGGFTIVLAISTIGLWLATNKLWAAGEKQFGLLSESAAAQSRDMQASIKAANDSAKAANRSAKVAEEALIAADRAWVSIEAEPIAPLVFEKDRIHVGVGIDLTNVGKSPATHLEVTSELCFDVIEAKNKGDEAAERSRYSFFDFGVVLFPSETEKRDALELEMPAETFRQNIVAAKARAVSDGDSELDWSTSHPAIMVCATYRLAGSKKRRHTVIVYELRRIDAPVLGWDGSEGETNLVLLKLVQTFMSGQVT
jgi:hypothetical protein